MNNYTDEQFGPVSEQFFKTCLENIQQSERSYHTEEYKTVYSWISRMSLKDIMFWESMVSKQLTGIPLNKYWPKVKIIQNDKGKVESFLTSLDYLGVR